MTTPCHHEYPCFCTDEEKRAARKEAGVGEFAAPRRELSALQLFYLCATPSYRKTDDRGLYEMGLDYTENDADLYTAVNEQPDYDVVIVRWVTSDDKLHYDVYPEGVAGGKQYSLTIESKLYEF